MRFRRIAQAPEARPGGHAVGLQDDFMKRSLLAYAGNVETPTMSMTMLLLVAKNRTCANAPAACGPEGPAHDR